MKRYLARIGYTFSFFSMMILVGLIIAPAVTNFASEPEDVPQPQEQASFAPGRLLVRFQPATDPRDIQQLLTKKGLQAVDEISELGIVTIAVPAGEEEKVANQLSDSPIVENAEVDHVYYALATPNDTFYEGTQWNLQKINAPTAWDTTTGSVNSVIAIIDTGVDSAHPDLAGKVLPGYNTINESTNVTDVYGHGTHVAGIAAAASNNGLGVAGVAWDSKVMPVKVLSDQGYGYMSDIAEGIIYAVDNGAQVINLSLGAGWSDVTMRDAVNYAYMHNVLVVAAAGNSSNNASFYPASYPHVISVAATDSADAYAYFSTYNANVDVAAPGVAINSTFPQASYKSWQGTSMASPHVAGLASLVLSVNGNLTPNQVTQVLENTSVDLGDAGRDDHFGFGRIDAAAAVVQAANPPTLGTVSGNVTDAYGAPIQGVMVDIYDASQNQVTGTLTDQNGDYSVSGLQTGSYKVNFNPWHLNFSAEWYADGFDFAAATPVSVTSGAITSGVDVALAAGGTVTGRITNPFGEPASGVVVNIYEENCFNENEELLPPVASGVSDAEGNYSIEGIYSGNYRIMYLPTTESNLVPEAYSDKPYLNWSDLVGIQGGHVTAGIDATLNYYGTMSGRVTDENGQGIGGIIVVALCGDCIFGEQATTEADGTYTIKRLWDDDFSVRFFSEHTRPSYLAEWYDNIPLSEATYGETTMVHVEMGKDTGGIDADLAFGGEINGVITDPSGQPLAGVPVFLGPSTGLYPSYKFSEADGSYYFDRLPAGDYNVTFNWGINPSLPYLVESYNDKVGYYSGDPIPVGAGQTVAGINAQLNDAAQFSGTVTDSLSQPIANVEVMLKSPNTTTTCDRTDADGTYRCGQIAPGTYQVKFCAYDIDPSYVCESYSNHTAPMRYDFTGADNLVLTAGQHTTGIDAQLESGGQITGRVTDQYGQSATYIDVFVYNEAGQQITNTTTNTNGEYQLGGMPAGSYKVYFSPQSWRLNAVPEWYNDKPDSASADLVVVTGGQTTAGIDAQLASNRISGRVTNEAGEPIEGIWVKIKSSTNPNTNYSQRSQTNANGEYVITNLQPGDWKLVFTDENPDLFQHVPYATEWYNDKTTWETADTISLILGQEVSNVDAQLSRSPVISGHVTDANGLPVSSVQVQAYSMENSWTPVSSTMTQADGSYTMDHWLGTGSYKLRFLTYYGSNVQSEWYNDKADYATADVVDVFANQTTTIDASLSLYGSITGRVTTQAGIPVEGAELTIYNAADPTTYVAIGYSQSDGTYVMPNLTTGTYKLKITKDLVGEWYNDKTDFNSADSLDVIIGQEISNADVQLSEAPSVGVISGRVTYPDGERVLTIVELYDEGHNLINWQWTDFTDGSYNFPNLIEGNYKVFFWAPPWSNHFSEWFSDAQDFASAEWIPVVGAQTSTTDAVLDFGRISGRVADENGNGIEGILVEAMDSNQGSQPAVTTDANGDYVISGLVAGDYKVRFDNAGTSYGSEWYNDKLSSEAADGVTVVAGWTIRNINAVLTTDVIAPTITSVLPSGSIDSSSTSIDVTYSDPAPASGINPASVSVTLDGQSV
ncbi:MAG: carboxypeptidase regulatory-like domain-containing protein, partial [Actinobacteria bacterium]|nr:carboxypeptidase regulatory-like domain-containing protein [Actinomycetota bacterium]